MVKVDQPQNENKDDLDDKLAIALNQLVQGKRSLLIRDYPSAVESLENACEFFDQIYGSNSVECGEVYLFYGIARLEMARLETGAFDGVVQADMKESSDEEEDDDEDDDQDENEDDEKPESNEEGKADGNEDKESKGDTDEDLEDIEIKANQISKSLENLSTGQSSSSSANNDKLEDLNTPSTSSGIVSKKSDEEEEPDATDMEIAWDSLNAAATIFRRQLDESKDIKLKLAECLQKLGEISIEWENNEHALKLLEESLSLRKECLPDDDRIIAETYYHIGIAFSFMSQIDKANDCYRSVISVIEKRIESKKELIRKTENLDEKDRAEKEVLELDEILKDMAAKIEDSQDQMKTVNDAIKIDEKEKMNEQIVADKIKEVQSKPVTNITHLVKRKRPGEPEVVQSPKKPCGNNP